MDWTVVEHEGPLTQYFNEKLQGSLLKDLIETSSNEYVKRELVIDEDRLKVFEVSKEKTKKLIHQLRIPMCHLTEFRYEDNLAGKYGFILKYTGERDSTFLDNFKINIDLNLPSLGLLPFNKKDSQVPKDDDLGLSIQFSSPYFWVVQDWLKYLVDRKAQISSTTFVSHDISRLPQQETEILFENERWILVWSKNLLPKDPLAWSDETGTQEKLKKDVILSKKWKWVNDWELDKEGLVIKCPSDKDGWRYTFDFGDNWLPTPQWNSDTRRRTWIRRRKMDDEIYFEKQIGMLDELIRYNLQLAADNEDLKIIQYLKGQVSTLFQQVTSQGRDGILNEKEILRRQEIIKVRETQLQHANKTISKQQPQQAKQAERTSRVWGEIDKRIDENKSLLQTQEDSFAEQNQELNSLLNTLQRQRHIASAIGDELDYQNELLEKTSNDVERVSNKLQKANKTADKIARS